MNQNLVGTRLAILAGATFSPESLIDDLTQARDRMIKAANEYNMPLSLHEELILAADHMDAAILKAGKIFLS